MKILVLTSTFSRRENDIEPKFVDNLCHYLAKDNELHVIAPHARGIPTEETMDGIPVFRFRYCFEQWETLAYDGGILPSLKQNRLRILLVPLFVLGQLLLAIKLVRKHNYDVIHAHWIIPQGLVALLARPFARAKPAVVLTSHGGDLFALKGTLLTKLKKWICQRADHLTVVSSAMKSRACELGLKKENEIFAVPMGVDSHDMFKPPHDDAQRKGLLFVGRLVDKKGIKYLIESLPAVLEKHPGATLTIIGDGPLKQQLLDSCRELGIEDGVSFLGSLVNQDIPSYLQAAAITVFPSVVTDSGDQEGTPVAIMEAMACECATIVSEYPGARDIIDDDENGLLVAQKSPSELAEKIDFLLESPETRSRLGKSARQKIQQSYDWKVISTMFLSLFQGVSKLKEK
jgi:glycosyltransferase involved in cell wall biosynthesis